jgi:hypothetical protein
MQKQPMNLKERAKEYLETKSKEISNRVKELGIQEDLLKSSRLIPWNATYFR